jgi:hypothetical protein
MATICLAASACLAQSKQPQSLCGLQDKTTEGSHTKIIVSGVYEGGLGNSGPAMGTLSDLACPEKSAWIEIALKEPHSRKMLNVILKKSGRAYVVFEGEFYGPPAPDTELPEALRKNSHPGWGHLGAFKTKLVVHEIRDVAPPPLAKRP